MKKTIALLLCIILCLGLSVPAFGAYNDDVTVSATLDKTELDYSADSAQTVVCTVALSKEVSVFSISLQADLPEGFTLAALESGSSAVVYDIDDGHYSLSTGKVSWYKSTNKLATNIVVLTVLVPAGTAAGSYQIGVKDIELGTDGENENKNWMEGESAYATLTINGDTASTGATLDKTYASVGVGGSITLIPSLLPTETAATVSSVTWDSSAPAVATVDGGVVTGVAEGTATITAHVTPSDSTTVYDATCTVTVVKSPYTVSVVRADASTDPIHPNEDITLNVTVTGDSFHGLQAALTFDSALFTYKSGSGDATIDTSTADEIQLQLNVDGDAKASGSTVAALVFTAQTPAGDSATGDFAFRYAKACNSTNAFDVGDSAAEGVTVTVIKQYTVKFMDKDGTQIGSDITLNAGDKITSVPDAPAVDYYDFTGWSDGTTTYATADAVKALVISKDTTFTATYKAKSFSVTLQSGITGNETATYGTDYEVTITDYDPTNYVYVVSYTAGSGAEQTATDNGNGTFTIPGANVTGELTVTFTKKLNASVVLHPDYVTGYTLITIAGSDAKAYSYDGNAMYFISGQNEYAWLVSSSVTQEEANAKVGEATSAAGTISFSNDINGDGKVDIADAVIVNSALNKRYDLNAANIAIYLRANVNAYDSYTINAADVNAIITDASYVK